MAKQKAKSKIPVFIDKCVIYFSKEDKCWIGHSLRTDQIGTGDCVVDALADVMLAVNQIIEAAKEDKTIQIFRNAPASVKRKAEKAEILPKELYEIAHKKVYGIWPMELEFCVDSKAPKHPYITEIREPALI